MSSFLIVAVGANSTQVAEERYSHELLAHADSIKVIENLKQQLGEAQASFRDSLASAETAQAKLSTSEASWKQQKDALDKEILDLNARLVLILVI
jgi:nucleoprotein TPR